MADPISTSTPTSLVGRAARWSSASPGARSPRRCRCHLHQAPPASSRSSRRHRCGTGYEGTRPYRLLLCGRRRLGSSCPPQPPTPAGRRFTVDASSAIHAAARIWMSSSLRSIPSRRAPASPSSPSPPGRMTPAPASPSPVPLRGDSPPPPTCAGRRCPDSSLPLLGLHDGRPPVSAALLPAAPRHRRRRGDGFRPHRARAPSTASRRPPPPAICLAAPAPSVGPMPLAPLIISQIKRRGQKIDPHAINLHHSILGASAAPSNPLLDLTERGREGSKGGGSARSPGDGGRRGRARGMSSAMRRSG
ncbi:Os02g0778800 [Oryza sativa Japonica Group]|uniref:Os02g0778800 protein n=1 Tax=Oryza sativa subsp. japonica TaxID=39947 RepID=A0A0P0VQH6_ORYSJ|nr:Os02g0778800 [Oryza sativa Japonica Group]